MLFRNKYIKKLLAVTPSLRFKTRVWVVKNRYCFMIHPINRSPLALPYKCANLRACFDVSIDCGGEIESKRMQAKKNKQ